MNFLFLSNTRFTQAPWKDATTRYRCYHHAEVLTDAGYIADVALADDIDLNTLDRYDIVIYSRPKFSRQLIRILAACQANNCTTIADFDDLVFSPEHASESPAVRNRQASELQMRKAFKDHHDALVRFDAVSVSTSELAHYVNSIYPGKKALKLENGLSRFWLERSAHLNLSTVNRSFITYLPGSRSHNADFCSIQQPLADLLQKHEDLVLKIVGTLDFDTTLFAARQLILEQPMDYVNLPAVINSSLCTIAPLTDTVFNQCKSHIKFIESAAFGTPIVASSNPDIARHQVDGLLIAQKTSDWITSIEKLLDKDYYTHCNNKLIEYAYAHCVNDSNVQLLINFTASLQGDKKNAHSGIIAKAG